MDTQQITDTTHKMRQEWIQMINRTKRADKPISAMQGPKTNKKGTTGILKRSLATLKAFKNRICWQFKIGWDLQPWGGMGFRFTYKNRKTGEYRTVIRVD